MWQLQIVMTLENSFVQLSKLDGIGVEQWATAKAAQIPSTSHTAVSKSSGPLQHRSTVGAF